MISSELERKLKTLRLSGMAGVKEMLCRFRVPCGCGNPRFLRISIAAINVSLR